jgi:hypothetical protein
MIRNPNGGLKQRVPRSSIRFLMGCLVFFIGMSPLRAGATALLQISGPEDTGQIVDADEAVAASFSLTQAFTNVSITAPTVCTGCSGGVYLVKNAIGPNAKVSDLIAAEAFNPVSSIISLTRNISLAPLDLASGDYFVILALENGILGSAGWSGSMNPTIMAVSGITAGIDFRVEDVNQGFPPLSNFQAILGNSRLHLLISGDVAVVPEPSMIALFGIALVALTFIRLRAEADAFRLGKEI